MAKKKENKKTNESVEKELKFSGRPERQEGETFEEYKARRKMLKAIQKQKLKGTVLWPSKFMGKYTKEMQGNEEKFIGEAKKYMENLAEELKKGKTNE